jgi:hypothetical protein
MNVAWLLIVYVGSTAALPDPELLTQTQCERYAQSHRKAGTLARCVKVDMPEWPVVVQTFAAVPSIDRK